MLINIDWLMEFVDIDLSPKTLADLLTNAGHESDVVPDENVLDVEITPNRPDCMSHFGIAREISVLTDKPLKMPVFTVKEIKEKAGDSISLEILNPAECPRYACRIVKNVEITPSPSWMAERLESVGIRSINNVVDISNYVLMELGHPLHIFDLDKLKDSKISVRLAKKDETFTTLDDIERKLNNAHLLICDGKRPVALAGVMGGLNSEVTVGTKNLLIESAYFDPVIIRKGSKLLGLSSESSKRFERGTDVEGLIFALDRTASMLNDITGGDVLSNIVDQYPGTKQVKTFSFNLNSVSEQVGIHFNRSFAEKTLTGLEVDFKNREDKFTCTSPTFRHDLNREEDVTEELARIYGYEKIDNDFSFSGFLTDYQKDPQYDIEILKQWFSGIGFQEIFTNSLISGKFASLFSTHAIINVKNPLSSDLSIMRNSLFPGLLNAASYNMRRGSRDLSLYEFGTVFHRDKQENICESYEFSGIICGEKSPNQWRTNSIENDYFTLKGYAEGLASFLKLENIEFQNTKNDDTFFPGQILKTSDSDEIIKFGYISGSIVQEFDIDIPIIGFSVDLEAVRNYITRFYQYEAISPFPGIERDLSTLMNKKITVGEVKNVMINKGTELLENIALYDIYEGKQVGENNKSVTFKLKFRDREKTLIDEDVDKIMASIISELLNKLDVKLR